MTGKWITATGLLLCILVSWTWAIPLQRNPGGDQDSDEVDSDEDDQKTSTNSPGAQNVTDQELTNKATLFLTRYFSNHGTEIPLHIPTNLNHTIVITVVPNNASSNAYENLGVESPPAYGGDLPVYSSQQQLQQQIQQYQQLFQEQKYQQQIQEQQYQQQGAQAASYQPSQPSNVTPTKELFGFVRQDKLPPVIPREATEQPNLPNFAHPRPTATPISTTMTTTTTASPVKEEPVDNIEDAILEALSIAGGGSGQGTSSSTSSPNRPGSPSQANNNFQALIDSGVIPGLSNSNNNGVIKVQSNFGPVFIQSEAQTTMNPGGTVFFNSNTPAPPVAEALPAPLQPNLVFLQHLIPPPSNSNSNDEDGVPERRPQGAAINAVSGIIGSISQGNLGGVVQNTIKLAETPVVQNTAKLATVAILHNVFQGLNPCNFLGSCRPRPAALKKEKTE